MVQKSINNGTKSGNCAKHSKAIDVRLQVGQKMVENEIMYKMLDSETSTNFRFFLGLFVPVAVNSGNLDCLILQKIPSCDKFYSRFSSS